MADESDADDEVNMSMLTVFSQTTGLVRVCHKSFNIEPLSIQREALISLDAFETMAEYSGATLREFSVLIERNEQASPTVFSNLTALRTLEWKSLTTFLSANTPEDGMQNLEELRILLASQSFLTALSRMRLNFLRRVVLSIDDNHPETFLEAHGPKLTELQLPYRKLKTLKVKIFEVCPNLRSILLPIRVSIENPPDADYFHSSQLVPSLVKITLDGLYCGPHMPEDEIAGWERFFTKFETKNFPSLREIEVKCCAWPTSERDIAKSCWVRWAEILLKRNISLMDKTGTKWRSRLKV